MKAALLCRRTGHPDRWVALEGGKVHCRRCHPPAAGTAWRSPGLRDFALDDVLEAIASAREQIRSAIRLGDGDGSVLARLLGPLAEVGFTVKRGHLGAAQSKGRAAIADVRLAAEATPSGVAARLAAAAVLMEGVVG